jgi:hypothetical protein
VNERIYRQKMLVPLPLGSPQLITNRVSRASYGLNALGPNLEKGKLSILCCIK